MKDETIDERIERLEKELAEARCARKDALLSVGTRVLIEGVIIASDPDRVDNEDGPYKVKVRIGNGNATDWWWFSAALVKEVE